MSDFASAAMLRLIRHGLQRQGLAAPECGPSRSAHIPLADKRALAASLLHAHGPVVLLRIGEAVRESPDEPALVALSIARDPLDLISRWQRLERFIHSRHRVAIEHVGDGRLLLRHWSLDAKSPPSVAEDLLVFGLLVALVERLGTQNLRARIAGDVRWRWRQAGWTEQALPRDASRWELVWTVAARTRDTSTPPPADHAWVDASRRVLAADPGSRWTLRLLAGDLRTSPRSLQRRLAAEDSGFSSLLTAVRLAHAATLLTRSRQAPAEIGYVCGFSDQAHFTREFKRHTALTPAKFREQFAAA